MSQYAKILIVDDSRIFRSALQASLAAEADLAVVGSVFSGEKALQFIRAAPPDVVTLDVQMPGMDGLETLRAIEQFNAGRPAGAEIGVIMLSAFTRSGADVTIRALQAGAFDFVAKPSAATGAEALELLRRDLVPKIRLFLARRHRAALGHTASPVASHQARSLPQSRQGTCRLRAILIAASTGGPRALATLLPGLCRLVDVPILIVQHMPPSFTRSLADSLAQQTNRAAREARDAEVLEPRTIYVAPGGKHLLVRADRHRRLLAGINEQPPESGCRPSANVLFRSAAAALGADAVAIVLTGMGNDGTAGLGPLKRAGARVLAQDESTSVVWGMPRSAWRPDSSMPSSRWRRSPRPSAPWSHARTVPVTDVPRMKLSAATLEELSGIIRELCGLALGRDKAYLIHHRLEPLMRQQGVRSFEELCRMLRQDHAHRLREALVQAITTRETSFFRDRHMFDNFRRHVLPDIIERVRTGARMKIRIWTAGVSTGQEAYSIAILLHQRATTDPPGVPLPEFSILGSDISSAALDIARRAEYGPLEIRRGLSPEETERCFEPCGNQWRVRRPIRRLIEFQRINLTRPFQDLGIFDAIFCRNVLIYFDEPTRRAICRQFEAMVPAGGYLVLGTAENLYGINDAFVSVRYGESLFYRRRS